MDSSRELMDAAATADPAVRGIKHRDKMQAVIQDRYGPLENVLKLEVVDRPTVGKGEALVRVRSAVVSGTDWHLLRGLPYAVRIVTGLRKPKNRVPGLEIAGTVEAVGGSVGSLEEGDEVFGWADGSFAEYVSVPVDQLSPKPANLSLVEAAVVPIAGFTALQGVRLARIQPGQKVLITGASGGVGIYAVQLAKMHGAEVTGEIGRAHV